MSRTEHPSRREPVEPAIGRSVPTALLPAAYLAVAAALSLLMLDVPVWRAVAMLLAVGRIAVPSVIAPWWPLLAFGVSQLWREPSATDPRFYLLLGGIHLLHVLGSLASVLPWHGRMQVVALVRPLRRFVLVQALVQPVAVTALLLFGRERGTVTGLSVLSAVLVGMVAAVLARRMGRDAAGPGGA